MIAGQELDVAQAQGSQLPDGLRHFWTNSIGCAQDGGHLTIFRQEQQCFALLCKQESFRAGACPGYQSVVAYFDQAARYSRSDAHAGNRLEPLRIQ